MNSPVRALAGALLVGALLPGCSGPGEPLEPGPSATSSQCAAVLQLAPQRVLDAAPTPVDVAGARAWGSPPVVLRCGVAEPGPTTLPCLEVDGVDWLVDVSSDPLVAVTYGRRPAIEVRVPAERGEPSLSAALVDLGPVSQASSVTGRACIG